MIEAPEHLFPNLSKFGFASTEPGQLPDAFFQAHDLLVKRGRFMDSVWTVEYDRLSKRRRIEGTQRNRDLRKKARERE